MHGYGLYMVMAYIFKAYIVMAYTQLYPWATCSKADFFRWHMSMHMSIHTPIHTPVHMRAHMSAQSIPAHAHRRAHTMCVDMYAFMRMKVPM